MTVRVCLNFIVRVIEQLRAVMEKYVQTRFVMYMLLTINWIGILDILVRSLAQNCMM